MLEKIKIQSNMYLLVGNLCNLTCSDCVFLSPFNFLGLQDWDKCKDHYEKWSEILDLDQIVCFGGEPYLNPQLDIWLKEFNRIWPKSDLELDTNGTRLKKGLELTRNFLQGPHNSLRISVHDRNDWQDIKQDLENILEIWNYYLSDESSVSDLKISYYEKNTNKFLAVVMTQDTFRAPFFEKVENGTVYLGMNGDQEESHKNCPFNDVYTFQDGLLYKCPLTVNYPDAKKQGIKFNPEAVEILDQYKPCSPYDSEEEIKEFFENIDKSIPQCSLCAYDKKIDPLEFSRVVNLDTNRKKVFSIKKI